MSHDMAKSLQFYTEKLYEIRFLIYQAKVKMIDKPLFSNQADPEHVYFDLLLDEMKKEKENIEQQIERIRKIGNIKKDTDCKIINTMINLNENTIKDLEKNLKEISDVKDDSKISEQ